MIKDKEELKKLFDIKVVDESFKIVEQVSKDNPDYPEKWKMQKAIFLYAQRTKRQIFYTNKDEE